MRFTTSHPRDFVKPIIDAIESNPNLCNHVHLPVQSGSSRVLEGMQRLYTRDQYMERIAWMKNARRPIAITSDIIVGFPGETRKGFRRDARSARRSPVRFDLQLQVFAAAQHGGARNERSHSGRRKIAAPHDRAGAAARHSDPPQCALIGDVEEVNVEGRHEALGQWIGRTSRNRTLNFAHDGPETADS